MKKVIAMAAVMSLASVAMAVPYASGVSQSGTNVSFILNQAANVQVVFDGGAQTLDMGAQTAGSLSFDMAGYSSWEIKCNAASLGAGFTQISDSANLNNSFYSPGGVDVNRNPLSTNFGTIYVTEAVSGTTGAGRTTTDGMYILAADHSDITGQGDTAHNGGVAWATGSSPYRPVIAPDDSVYIADWSDAHSGVWVAQPNGAGTFTQVLADENRQSSGLCDNHGSISSVLIEGSGANTKMLTLDEDFNMGTIQQYDIGTGSEYAGQPSIVMDNRANQVFLNARSDFVRDPRTGNFWVAQYRYSDTAGAPSLMCFEEGGNDPIYNSGADANLQALDYAYGSVDITSDGNFLVMGTRSGNGAYVLDISDPANPSLVGIVPHFIGYIQDVSFDAAGNIYLVSSSSELLTVWSPEGDYTTILSSCGDFTVVPEPASLALLALGGLALIRRR